MSEVRVKRVSDDELYHWKYVKREKKNGKWKYYYDNAVKKIKEATGYDHKEDMRKYKAEMAERKQDATIARWQHADATKVRDDYANKATQYEKDATKFGSEAFNTGIDSAVAELDYKQTARIAKEDGNVTEKEIGELMGKGKKWMDLVAKGETADANKAISLKNQSVATGKSNKYEQLRSKKYKEVQETSKAYHESIVKYRIAEIEYNKSLAAKIDKAKTWLKGLFD